MLRQRNGEKKRSQYFFVVLEIKLDCEFLQIGSKRNNSFSGIKKAAMLFMKSTAAFSGKHGSFFRKARQLFIQKVSMPTIYPDHSPNRYSTGTLFVARRS